MTKIETQNDKQIVNLKSSLKTIELLQKIISFFHTVVHNLGNNSLQQFRIRIKNYFTKSLASVRLTFNAKQHLPLIFVV